MYVGAREATDGSWKGVLLVGLRLLGHGRGGDLDNLLGENETLAKGVGGGQERDGVRRRGVCGGDGLEGADDAVELGVVGVGGELYADGEGWGNVSCKELEVGGEFRLDEGWWGVACRGCMEGWGVSVAVAKTNLADARQAAAKCTFKVGAARVELDRDLLHDLVGKRLQPDEHRGRLVQRACDGDDQLLLGPAGGRERA